MDDNEIWELAKKPVEEFIESIKEMNVNVDRLVKFYLKYTKEQPKLLANSSSIGRTSLANDQQQVLSPLACAKLELAIVFAINSCYWMYLVTHGQDPTKNEISKDLERIRLFMNRAKEVEDSLTGTSASVKRPKIDKDACRRLCMNNLWSSGTTN